MTENIGKYKIFIEDNGLKIRYRYSFSDLIGGLWFLLMIVVGILLLTTAHKTFNLYQFNSWLVLTCGVGLLGFGSYLLVVGLYNPTKGVFQVDKTQSTIIIRDFLKTHSVDIDNFLNLTYKLESSTRPRTNYAVITLTLKDKKKIDCFIIRSSIPIDLGRRVDKELHKVSRQLRDRIIQAIKDIKNNP